MVIISENSDGEERQEEQETRGIIFHRVHRLNDFECERFRVRTDGSAAGHLRPKAFQREHPVTGTSGEFGQFFLKFQSIGHPPQLAAV